MKRLLTFFTFLFFAAAIFSQAPEKMSYQAVIRNSGDQLIKNTNISIQISILQGSVSGTTVYVERHFPATNDNGLVSIEIGLGTVVSGNFSNIDWSNGAYFLKTETDLNGGSNYTITGTSQLLSVPYALYAKTAETILGGITETDPVFVSSAANEITSTNILNWTSAFSWGSHAGLYRPISYVPTWNEIISNPFSISSASNNQLLKYNSTSGKWENWTPDFLTSLSETDPLWTVASPNYYTKGNMQTSGTAQLHFNNISNKPTTVAGYGIIDAVTTSGNQVIAGNKTFSGTTTVQPPVNAMDAATKAYVDDILLKLNIIPNNYSGTVTDHEGNTYKTVTIGSQVWMAENLRTERYNDGVYIQLVTENDKWIALTYPAHCWYYNDPNSYRATYGALYNWYTVITGNLCPTGWHVPTDNEWKILEVYLGMSQSEADKEDERGTGEGMKLKEAGTAHWNDTYESSNESGFTALPGDSRSSYLGGFNGSLGIAGYWWSSTERSSTEGWMRGLFTNPNVLRGYSKKTVGMSVRCVKD